MRGRIRTAKPEVLKDEELWDLEVSTGLPLYRAFQGLWFYADREGRFEWRPRALKSDILPYWDGNFDAVLDALARGRFIVRYTVDGREYGWVRTLTRHQRFDHREPPSILPPPPTEDPGHAEESPGHARVEGKGRELERKGTEGARAPDGSLPEVPGLAKVVLPGHLPPSKRERDEAARDASLGKLRHKYTPGWRPTKAVNLARALEIGVTEPQLWQRWDECRDKRYPSPFDDDEGQFNRELAWLKSDLEKQAFQRLSKADREAFELPGKERRA